jgi:hypothetical protein
MSWVWRGYRELAQPGPGPAWPKSALRFLSGRTKGLMVFPWVEHTNRVAYVLPDNGLRRPIFDGSKVKL